MVRRLTARGFEVERSYSLRKCIRPLSGELFSGHLMMIRACRSFKMPRSLGTRLSVQVFRHAVGLFFRLLLSSADLGRAFFKIGRRGGGKVESVLGFPSAASFPRPASGCGHLQRLVLIVFAAGQYRPRDASEFVGDRDHDFISWGTLGKSMHPLPETSSVVLDAQQDCASTVDQHAPQIMVAALADAE